MDLYLVTIACNRTALLKYKLRLDWKKRSELDQRINGFDFGSQKTPLTVKSIIDLQLTQRQLIHVKRKSMSPKNIAGIKAAKQIAIEATKGTALVSVWNRMMNNTQLTRSRYE